MSTSEFYLAYYANWDAAKHQNYKYEAPAKYLE